MRTPSIAAAISMNSGQLDFVIIDANHEECSVREDVAAWYSKIRIGGLLIGTAAAMNPVYEFAAAHQKEVWCSNPTSVWAIEL
jgi:hypothetical protein